MVNLPKLIIPGLIFLLTLASGIWLSKAGKPLNAAIFNVHKLVALGAVITGGVQVFKLLKNAGPQALTAALLVMAGLCVIALFASGALMSIGKVDYRIQLNLHKAAAILAVVITAGLAALLARLGSIGAS